MGAEKWNNESKDSKSKMIAFLKSEDAIVIGIAILILLIPSMVEYLIINVPPHTAGVFCFLIGYFYAKRKSTK